MSHVLPRTVRIIIFNISPVLALAACLLLLVGTGAAPVSVHQWYLSDRFHGEPEAVLDDLHAAVAEP